MADQSSTPNGDQAPGDGSLGSLGKAFLTAGFRTDGSTDPEEPAAPVEEVSPEGQEPTNPPPSVEPTQPDTTLAEAPPKPVEEEEPRSPYDRRGSWYVIHSYSGHEKKVRANLDNLKTSQHLEHSIFEVVIPTEKVVEIKAGRKVEVERRMFPGYLLIRMYDDAEAFNVVRNTPGVTSFVGSSVGGGFHPTPLSRREVERFMGLKREAAKKAPRFRPAWEVGETVRVSKGPFADFNGVVSNINVDQQKVTVLVEIFGRDTPMELDFEDIQKQ